MANALPKRKRSGTFNEIPRIYRGRTQDGPATLALWKRFKGAGDPSAFHALVCHYASSAYMMAVRLQRKNPERFTDFDAMVSDGTLGLIKSILAIDCPLNLIELRQFRKYCIWGIVGTICDERFKFTTFFSTRVNSKFKFVSETRADLTMVLGRLPTPQEVAERLHGKIDNPYFYIDREPRMESAGDFRDMADMMPSRDPSRDPSGDSREDDSRLVELRSRRNAELKSALKKLDAADRKIARMVMTGKDLATITQSLGTARRNARRRVNSILWLLRSNAQLAASLDVEAATLPTEKTPNDWPAISSLGPAKLRIAAYFEAVPGRTFAAPEAEKKSQLLKAAA